MGNSYCRKMWIHLALAKATFGNQTGLKDLLVTVIVFFLTILTIIKPE